MQAHPSPASAKAANIKLMIFDVDGILTDGSLHFSADGEVMKTFNVLDGQGIKLLQNAGIATAIISARKSAIVTKRATDLGITHIRQGIHDKRRAFLELIEELQLQPDQCGFIGDDVIDLPILLLAGFAASVPNGHAEVRRRVDFVTETSGGRGAAREVCDFILKAQGKYDAVLAPFLNGN